LVEDTLSRDIIEAEFDLVVLAAGLTPSKSTEKIAEQLKLAVSDDGFLKEAHPKYRPVDTLVEGVFLAGTVQGPKDIPDTVAQGSAAAGRVIATLAKGEFAVDPMLAFVHDDKCTACGECYEVCPVNAIAENSDGKAEIKETLCVGCGACLGACSEEAIDLNGFTNIQLYSAVEAALAGKKPGEKRALVFGDSNCTYRVADAAGVRKMKYANDNRVLMVPSSCRVTPNLVAFAFAKGADIVLIGDCPEKGNKFEWAHDFAKKYIEQAKQILADKGIETDRIIFDDFTASNLPKFVNTLNSISEQMKKLPNIDPGKRAELNPLEK
jgi:heterodisulfide reductase subunit A